MSKTVGITLVKSKFGRKKGHLETLQGLGLRRIGHRVVREDTKAIRGMIGKVEYLLRVDENPDA